MNKLTKQLLSLGLSVVTVAGMVSPVFADDDVSTLENQPNTTDVVEQETTNNEQQPQAAVPGQSEDSQVDTSEGGTTSDDQTVMKTYNLKIVYQYEDREETTTFTTSESVDQNVISYLERNFVPEGYRFESCTQTDPSLETWTLTVAKYKDIELKFYKDGTFDYNTSTSCPSVYNDEQIKEYISKYYAWDYNVKSIEKQADGSWLLNLVTPDPENETFKLIINKDGQETTSTITISKENQKAYGDIRSYLIKNYLPDGYHIDNSLDKGIGTLGTDTWKMYIVKDNENPTLKTYRLKLILRDSYSLDDLENARIEYHTFEYDSSYEEGLEDYMTKEFLPEGYYWVSYPSKGQTSFVISAYKVENLDKHPTQQLSCSISYVDSQTKENVLKYDRTIGITSGKDKISVSDLDWIPVGYVVDGNSFDVTKSESGLKATVYVKKGEYKVPVTIHFYEEANNRLSKLTTVKAIAQDMDVNKNEVIDVEEIKNAMPKGYDFADPYDLYQNYVFTNVDSLYLNNLEFDVRVKKEDSIITSEESKNIATIENEDLKAILNDSLSKEQKEKVEEAINNNQTVEFVPVLKESVKSEDKEVLEDYAQKNDVNVVNAFDIEIQLYIDNEQVGTIPVTNKELVFKVSIPNELKKSGRQFYILRLHDGKVDKIPVNEDGTFTTNKFSSYMLVYEDVSSSSKPTEGTKDDNKTPSTPEKTNPSTETKDTSTSKTEEAKNTTNTSSKSNKSTSTKKGVNTGLKTQSTLFAGLAAISVASIGLVEVLKRRK